MKKFVPVVGCLLLLGCSSTTPVKIDDQDCVSLSPLSEECPSSMKTDTSDGDDGYFRCVSSYAKKLKEYQVCVMLKTARITEKPIIPGN